MSKSRTIENGEPEPEVLTEGESGNRVYFSVARTVNLGIEDGAVRVAYGESRTVPDGESLAVIKKKTMAAVIKTLDEMIPAVTGYLKNRRP